MSLISKVIDPLEVLDSDAVSSRRIPIDDYSIFTKVDLLEILQCYIDECIASCIRPVAYSYDELPNAPLEPPLRRKRKASKMVDDEPSRTVKSPTKVAKTSASTRRPLGTVLEDDGEGSKNTEKDEESPTQNQSFGKASIIETSLPFDQVVNTLSSFTPL